MPRKVAFIHTVASLVGPFNELAVEFFPADTVIYHIADEMLLKIVLADGGLSPFIYKRVAHHVADAAEAGVNLIQVTCSSISPCVESAQNQVGIPVLKIDVPMVDQALTIGLRVGVAATVATTLGPTSELVVERARIQGRAAQVDPLLCDGAFPALMAGDTNTHDSLVREGLAALMARNDVVMLAQASMARVADTIPESDRTVPILSSPRLAMAHAAEVLG